MGQKKERVRDGEKEREERRKFQIDNPGTNNEELYNNNITVFGLLYKVIAIAEYSNRAIELVCSLMKIYW